MSDATRCGRCGYEGAFRRRYWPRILWLAPIWSVPLGFLLVGYWPFGLLAALALSAWLLWGLEARCPRCGAGQP
ncbi:MAG: hypothetical protein PVF91_07940 [Chromatiales bacterium]|jgi:hypothetical protein